MNVTVNQGELSYKNKEFQGDVLDFSNVLQTKSSVSFTSILFPGFFFCSVWLVFILTSSWEKKDFLQFEKKEGEFPLWLNS